MNTQEQTDYDDKVKAARAMLAALAKTQAWVRVYETMPGHDAAAASMGRIIAAAIAQAESAGITSEE